MNGIFDDNRANRQSSRGDIVQPSRRGYLHVALLLLVCGVALFVRWTFMTESLWFDELWSTEVQLSDLPKLLRTIADDNHPPAYSTFMFCWIHVFGDSELSIRIPPLAAGVGTLVLIYLISRRIGGTGMALMAASLFILSPVAIWYATEARAYSAWIFCTILSAYALLRNEKEVTWRWIYGLSIFAAQGMHYYTFFLVCTLSALALVTKPRVKWILCTNAVVTGIFFLYVIVKLVYEPPRSSHTGILGYSELVRLFGIWFPHGNTLNIGLQNQLAGGLKMFYLVVFCVGIGTLVGRFRWSSDGWRTPESVTLIFLLSPVLGVLLASLVFQTGYIDRSVVIALPFYLIIISLVVCTIRVRLISVSLGVLLIALALVSVIQLRSQGDRWTVYKPNPNWRNAAEFLRPILEDRDSPIQVICLEPYQILPLKYYLRSDSFRRLHVVRVSEAQKAFEMSVGGGSRYLDFIIIQNHFWYGKLLEEIIDQADALYQRLWAFRCKGITVYYYSNHR